MEKADPGQTADPGPKRVIAIAIDDSEHAENALKCKFLFLY